MGSPEKPVSRPYSNTKFEGWRKSLRAVSPVRKPLDSIDGNIKPARLPHNSDDSIGARVRPPVRSPVSLVSSDHEATETNKATKRRSASASRVEQAISFWNERAESTTGNRLRRRSTGHLAEPDAQNTRTVSGGLETIPATPEKRASGRTSQQLADPTSAGQIVSAAAAAPANDDDYDDDATTTINGDDKGMSATALGPAQTETTGLGVLIDSSRVNKSKTIAMVTSREVPAPEDAGAEPSPTVQKTHEQQGDSELEQPGDDGVATGDSGWASSSEADGNAARRVQGHSWGQSSAETFLTTESPRHISPKNSGSLTNASSSPHGQGIDDNDQNSSAAVATASSGSGSGTTTTSTNKANRASNTSIEQWRGEAVGMIATPFATKQHHPNRISDADGAPATIKMVPDTESLEAFEYDISRRLKADDKSSDLTLTFERDSDSVSTLQRAPGALYGHGNRSVDAISPQTSPKTTAQLPHSNSMAMMSSSALPIHGMPITGASRSGEASPAAQSPTSSRSTATPLSALPVTTSNSSRAETMSLLSSSPPKREEVHHNRRLSRIGSDIDKRVRRGKEALRRQTSVATSRMSTLSIYGLNPSLPSQAVPSSEVTRTPSIRTYENFLRAKDLEPSKFVAVPSSMENVALWFLKQIILSKTNGQGAFVSERLYIPYDLWNMTSIQASLLLPRCRCLDSLSKLALDIIQETQDSDLSKIVHQLELEFHVAFVYPLNWDGDPQPAAQGGSTQNQNSQPPTPPAPAPTSPTHTSKLNGMLGRFRRKTIAPSEPAPVETPAPAPAPAPVPERCSLDQYLSSIASLAASLESMDQYVETIAGLTPQPRHRIAFAEEYRRFASKTACSLLLKDIVILQSVYKEEFYEFLINVN